MMSSEALTRGLSIALPDPNRFAPIKHQTTNFVTHSSSQEERDRTLEESEDATLRLITQMLMEEDDLDEKPCMYQESLALQATERSFYKVLLGEKYPLDDDGNQINPLFDSCKISDSPDDDSSSKSWSSSTSPVSVVNEFVDFSWVRDRELNERTFYSKYTFESILQSLRSIKGPNELENVTALALETNLKKQSLKRENSISVTQKNKQLASSIEGFDEAEVMFDEILLCTRLNNVVEVDVKNSSTKFRRNRKSKGGNKSRNRRQESSNKEVVDLTTLLIQCAQAVSISDTRNADELLKKIRQHSSPNGDGTERAAHYFANALYARISGTGTELYAAYKTRSRMISAADVLKGYQVYVKASPFNKMTNLFANRSICKLAEKATRIHIIDLGIMYGFQYPCLIQHLSARPGGPPKLRITGIDFPQPGFRPTERIEETGRRLSTYCKRFNVPFEYTAIAKNWETIELDDIKIEDDEVLMVNCMYRLRNVPDETVMENSPRDAVLNLVKRINPDMFIHGVLSASYNTSIFISRFKDALFSFCSRFDMFEENVPREEWGRMLFERELYGRDIMNAVACEGTERVERPESYKQWQIRTARAGFRQMELDREMVDNVREMVKAQYHKDYVIDTDSNWMLQGWKGRIVYAISCWKPLN